MRSGISGVKNSWQRVKSETIVKSFKKCGISNAIDGSEDDILYEEIDASSEKNQEDDLSGSDADFLGFCDEYITLWCLILDCNNPFFLPKNY
jgi:hypothetical protein